MEIFAQQCKKCNEFITAELDNERPKHLVKWLHRWIAEHVLWFSFSFFWLSRKTDSSSS